MAPGATSSQSVSGARTDSAAVSVGQLAAARSCHPSASFIQSVVFVKRFIVVAVVAFMCGCVAQQVYAGAKDEIAAQRQDYRAALRAIAANDEGSYRAAVKRLHDYPLLPYLEFARLNRPALANSATRLSAEALDDFAKRFPDTPLLDDLKKRWLQDAAQSNDWPGYLQRFESTLHGTELACWRLEALYRTGESAAALDAMPQLWLTPKPLPKACDGIIALWRHDRGVDEELIWQRVLAAVTNNDIALAQQLVPSLSSGTRTLGMRLISVHEGPQRLRRLLFADTEHSRAVIAEGLRRYARIDATAATETWLQFQSSHHFTPAMHRSIELELVRRAADQDRLRQILPIPVTPDGAQSDAVEAVLRYTIRHQRWKDLLIVLQDLPADRKASPRWQYWQARATQLTTDENTALANADYTQAYARLAQDRSYYGFLAADRLHQPPNLAAQDPKPTPEALAEAAARPGVRRAFELSVLGDHGPALREWRYCLAALNLPHKLAAATLAAQRHWYRLSIQSVIDATAWDALALRFPIVYADAVRAAATARGLDPSWLYAITRQESAFAADARSPAGAVGLMQLLPGTGANTARALGMPFQTEDLLKPEINMRLGAYYLAQMYRNFGYHRALAAAAYNAGPGRVREWLQRLPASPLDVWVEAIPFDETQRYVQNVLVYAHIYSRFIGTHQPFLFDHER